MVSGWWNMRVDVSLGRKTPWGQVSVQHRQKLSFLWVNSSWEYWEPSIQLLLCGAQSCGLPLRMPSRSSLTTGTQGEKIKLGTMTRFSCEARVSCYTSTTQMPTVTGLSGLSFLGMSFEQEHLTAEVRHKNLPLIPSINSRANNVANNVTPRSYPGGQCEAAQHHGKQLEKQPLKGMDPFLTSLLPFFFKNRISITHEILSLPCLCSYWFRRNTWCFEFFEDKEYLQSQ